MRLPCIFLAAVLACSARAEEPTTLKVLVWNIRRCVGMDGKSDIARTAAVITRQNPEVVLLQEVDQNTRRSGGVDQVAELAKLTGMNTVFGKAIAFDGGAYGLAILSRHPVQNHTVHPLPSGDEGRIALEAVVSVNGREIRLLNTHSDLDAGKRLLQAEKLNQLFPGNQVPTVLAGDFNATPGSPMLAALGKSWSPTTKSPPTLTCPADKPVEEIDHIFLSGITQKDPVAVVAEPVASDHRPISATLVIPPHPKSP